MKKIYLVRHAQSAANVGQVITDHASIGITSAGQHQALRLAELLTFKASKVLTSKFTRTQQTSQPYCQTNELFSQVHPLLHEFETVAFNGLGGLTEQERQQQVTHFWEKNDPDYRLGADAETFREFSQRVADFQSDLITLQDNTVIFGHGMWHAFLIWRLLGFTAVDSVGMKAFRAFQLALPMPNCGVYTLEHFDAGKWHVEAQAHIISEFSTFRAWRKTSYAGKSNEFYELPTFCTRSMD